MDDPAAILATENRPHRGQNMKGKNMTNTPAKPRHKATYAKDKKHPGSYNIRVVGPQSMEFAGRKVPVTLRSGEVQEETLGAAFWSGDDKDDSGRLTGDTVTLYKFVATPKEKEPEAAF